MSKHEYSVGQTVLVKYPRRRDEEPMTVAAAVTKVGRVWGTAKSEGPYPREWIFDLETGVEKGTETWQPVYVVTPERAAEMDRIKRRDRRLFEARVFPSDSSLRSNQVFLDALDVLVAEHLGKEADR